MTNMYSYEAQQRLLVGMRTGNEMCCEEIIMFRAQVSKGRAMDVR